MAYDYPDASLRPMKHPSCCQDAPDRVDCSVMAGPVHPSRRTLVRCCVRRVCIRARHLEVDECKPAESTGMYALSMSGTCSFVVRSRPSSSGVLWPVLALGCGTCSTIRRHTPAATPMQRPRPGMNEGDRSSIALLPRQVEYRNATFELSRLRDWNQAPLI